MNGRHEPLRSRIVTSAFGQLDLDFHRPRLKIVPGWRWQRSADDFPPVVQPWLAQQATPLPEPHVVHAVSPSVAVIWEASSGRLFVESHWSRSTRFPNWVELFGGFYLVKYL